MGRRLAVVCGDARPVRGESSRSAIRPWPTAIPTYRWLAFFIAWYGAGTDLIRYLARMKMLRSQSVCDDANLLYLPRGRGAGDEGRLRAGLVCAGVAVLLGFCRRFAVSSRSVTGGTAKNALPGDLLVTANNVIATRIWGRSFGRGVGSEERNEALEHFREALEINSRDYLAHNNLGITLIERQQWQEAAEQFQAAIRLRPTFAPAYANLALALGEMGRYGEAEGFGRDALGLDSELATAENVVAISLAAQGRQEEAIPHYRRASNSIPARPIGTRVWASRWWPSGQLPPGSKSAKWDWR